MRVNVPVALAWQAAAALDGIGACKQAKALLNRLKPLTDPPERFTRSALEALAGPRIPLALSDIEWQIVGCMSAAVTRRSINSVVAQSRWSRLEIGWLALQRQETVWHDTYMPIPQARDVAKLIPRMEQDARAIVASRLRCPYRLAVHIDTHLTFRFGRNDADVDSRASRYIDLPKLQGSLFDGKTSTPIRGLTAQASSGPDPGFEVVVASPESTIRITAAAETSQWMVLVFGDRTIVFPLPAIDEGAGAKVIWVTGYDIEDPYLAATDSVQASVSLAPLTLALLSCHWLLPPAVSEILIPLWQAWHSTENAK